MKYLVALATTKYGAIQAQISFTVKTVMTRFTAKKATTNSMVELETITLLQTKGAIF